MSNLSAVISADDPRTVRGVAITRPLKLENPDILKTITTVVHRGKFRPEKVSSILFGSRDGFDYIPLASSVGRYIRRVHGSPYNYFRLVLIADLSRSEALSRSTVEFEVKYTNKVR